MERKVWASNEEDPNDPNDGYWEPTLDRPFVWYNWLMLLELDENNDVVRKYTWGLDLAGQSGGPTSGRSSLESAGGIGGLLAMYDPNDPNDPNDTYGNYVYFHDANGNVGQLVDWENDGALVAKYEYDPYGGELAATGDYADDNPIRFSTKYFDDETALGYWGYRYYGRRLGRWLSREPLEEQGSLNLYRALRNSPHGYYDYLGREDQASGGDTPPQNPPSSQPASQPAVDKSVACCFYMEIYVGAGTGGGGVHTQKCCREESCPRYARSATDCCKCECLEPVS